MKKITNIVIIGCSGCGAMSALMLKRIKPDLDVTIIRKPEEKGLLTRCATPYICCGNVTIGASYKTDEIFVEKGIKLVDESAVEVNKEKHVVNTADGGTYPYDKLVLATGSNPARLPIPGVDLPGVFELRTSEDAFNILNWINSKRIENCVLLGAGAIGIEKAYLLSRHGIKVTIVEKLGHIMPTVLDKDMSEGVEAYMRGKNIQLELNQTVVAIDGKDEVKSMTLASGKKIDAEMVVISAGTRSNIELAKNAKLDLGLLGLKVNEYLQTSDPDIYAGGDLIEYANQVTGKPSLGQLRPNAVIAGRVIAKNIMGFQIKYPFLTNSFCTIFFDKFIAGTGISEAEAGREGIEVIAVKQKADSEHSMMQDRKPYIVKLIFNKQNQKIIGGQIVSDAKGPIKHIDVIALAIRCGLTITDLTTLRCAGQPELSPDPGKEPIALAAEMAFEELHYK